MLTIREVIKTFYNALLQRLKKHRGNWEQNDPTADDYIKNRPFYTDETNKKTVVKTKTFTAENPYWWGSPFAFIPVVGETYRVVFDGKEYICQCKSCWDASCIGNIGLDWDGPDTGEPFFYYWYDSYDYGMCVRYQGKHTITIEKIDVTKIDERYLPDNLARHEDIDNLYDYANYLSNEVWNKVSYTQSQNLSTSQKQIARTNIGAAATSDLATVANTGDYNDLSNRPCYLEIEMTPYLGVTNKTVSMSFVNSNVTNVVRYGRILSNPSAMPVNGTTYHIIYNGIEYDVTSNNPANLLGNKSLYSSSYENTGEPFAVLCDPANLWLYHTGTATSATISIYTIINKDIKQLSEELIPDTIARVSDLPTLAPVATTGSYNSLSDKPTIPAAQVQSDWNQRSSTSKAHVLNRPFYEDEILSNSGDLSFTWLNSNNQLINYTHAFTYQESNRGVGCSVGINPTYSSFSSFINTYDDPTKDYVIKYYTQENEEIAVHCKYHWMRYNFKTGNGRGFFDIWGNPGLVYLYTSAPIVDDNDNLLTLEQLDNGLPFAIVTDNSGDYWTSGIRILKLNVYVKEIREIYEYSVDLKQLDEKFIPSTIARTEDIVQSDWNETNESSLSFIKNKPDFDTAKNYITLVDQINGFTYYVCMRNGNLTSYCAVQSISVTTLPDKTEYAFGEYFDPTGMVITATAYDGTFREITSYTYLTEPLVEGMTSVEITYTERNMTHTTNVPITVLGAADALVDFEYTDNGDGTYTITDWKGTYNGEASTEMIIPNSSYIIV